MTSGGGGGGDTQEMLQHLEPYDVLCLQDRQQQVGGILALI